MSDPVARARALLAAAETGFPWVADDVDAAPGEIGRSGGMCTGFERVATVDRPEDAALIAAAPALLAELADEVEQLRAFAADQVFRTPEAAALALRDGLPQVGRNDSALDLLAKLASGEGGRRTGALKRAGLLEWTVTPAGWAALGGRR